MGEDEQVFFKVSGTHTVYLTGNYLVPESDSSDEESYGFDTDYDLSPDEDELDEEEEGDELDDLDDPRITELTSDDEEPPKLIGKDAKGAKDRKDAKPVAEPAKAKMPEVAKGSKNKRAAEDEGEDPEPPTLDDIMSKSLKPATDNPDGEPKLSKKQLKKLKNNAGKAVQPPAGSTAKKDDAPPEGNGAGGKGDKKVQFAKNLESGPSGEGDVSKADAKTEKKKDGKSGGLGIKTVQGVVIDDRKLGTGPAAKNGDKVGLRYIGKLQTNLRQFDGTFTGIMNAPLNSNTCTANKSGPPFRFKIGANEVIKGWDIGVKGMSVGGERRITIPPELGYGKKAMDKIPANSTLIFEIKLLSID